MNRPKRKKKQCDKRRRKECKWNEQTSILEECTDRRGYLCKTRLADYSFSHTGELSSSLKRRVSRGSGEQNRRATACFPGFSCVTCDNRAIRVIDLINVLYFSFVYWLNLLSSMWLWKNSAVMEAECISHVEHDYPACLVFTLFSLSNIETEVLTRMKSYRRLFFLLSYVSINLREKITSKWSNEFGYKWKAPVFRSIFLRLDELELVLHSWSSSFWLSKILFR